MTEIIEQESTRNPEVIGISGSEQEGRWSSVYDGVSLPTGIPNGIFETPRPTPIRTINALADRVRLLRRG
jgi:hypothetical protein